MSVGNSEVHGTHGENDKKTERMIKYDVKMKMNKLIKKERQT